MERRWPTLLMLLLLAVTGCSGGQPETAAIRRADRISLYEGLPHPFYETELFKKEKLEKPTVVFGGDSFYRDPLELKEADKAELRDLIGNPDSFQKFVAEKKCGGFHPDYAVEWTYGADKWICLLCFGCGEAKVLHDKVETRFDLESKAGKQLKALLEPYRNNRPEKGPNSGP